MSLYTSLEQLRDACLNLPAGDTIAALAAASRQDTLTKPPGSLGKLEELAIWLARWQGRERPQLDKVDVLVFAGSHGVTARGVSAFPSAVTVQMVGNFAAGGAAINQLARVAGAQLRVIPLDIETPTGDICETDAMTEAEFLSAVSAGYTAVDDSADLICLGEMGIGNTTTAAAVAAMLFGGSGAEWVGRGTGVDDAGLSRKRLAVDAALRRHAAKRGDPIAVLASVGGRELAAIFGATLAARHHGIPVLLDGFVCTAAAAPLAQLSAEGLAHAQAAHVSAEAGHRRLLSALSLTPLLDLGMRLGEASGACLAVNILRAAVACHNDMATFEEAQVSSQRGA